MRITIPVSGVLLGGGSACVYQPPETAPYGEGPPWIGFVLIPGKGWTERRQTIKLLPGCVKPQATDMSARPTLIAFAKVVVSKVQ